MSMRGINWWKERRHSERPATSYKPLPDPLAVAFDSDAFRSAIASHLDPAIAKLNQIKAANLNLDATLHGFKQQLEELAAGQKDSKDHLTTSLDTGHERLEKQLNNLSTSDERIEDQLASAHDRLEKQLSRLTTDHERIEGQVTASHERLEKQLNSLSSGHERVEGHVASSHERLEKQFKELSSGHERVENQVTSSHESLASQLNDLFSGQTRLLKSIETRFDNLESRIEALDEKIDQFDESITNADLRSAIRFGEISNELQDRNTLLGDRIWEVQRDVGKKIDGQQRKVLGACEELGKDVRNINDNFEAMQEENSESEKALHRQIQEKVEKLEKKMVEITRGIEASNLASLESRASRIEDLVTGKIQNLVELNEVSQGTSRSEMQDGLRRVQNEVVAEITRQLEAGMTTTADKLDTVSSMMQILANWTKSHATKSDVLASSQAEKLEEAVLVATRLEGAFLTFDGRALGKLEKIETGLAPISSHTTRLTDIESTLQGMSSAAALSEMKSEIGAVLFSQNKSLDSIQQRNAAHVENMASRVSEIQASLQNIQTDVSNSVENLKTTTKNQDHVAQNLTSITQATREDIATLQTTVLETLQNNGSALDEARKPLNELSLKLDDLSTNLKITSTKEDIASLQARILQNQEATSTELSAKFDHFSTSNSSLIRNLDHNLHSTTRSTADEIHEHFKGLDRNLDDRFASMKEAFHEDSAVILDQVQAAKAFLETEVREELKSSSATIMAKLQEAKDDEILLEIESLGRNYYSRQNSSTSAITEMLETFQQKQQHSLADVSKSLQSMEILNTLQAIKSTLDDASNTETLNNQLEQINPAIKDVKQLLLQNQSSMATAYEGIIAVDTKILASEEAMITAVEELQASLGRDILDASSSITTSVNDNLTDVKVDLASRISTSTSVLRAEMKRIDPNLESLKDDIQSTSKMAREDIERVAESIQSSFVSSTDSLRGTMVDFSNDHNKKLQENAASLRQVEELLTANSASISKNLISTLDQVSETKQVTKMIATAVKSLEQTSQSNSESLSTVEELVGKVTQQVDAMPAEFQSHMDASAKETLQVTREKLQEISTMTTCLSEDVGHVQETLDLSDAKEDIRMIVGAVQGLDHIAKTHSENLSVVREQVFKANDRFDKFSTELKQIHDCGTESLQIAKSNNTMISKIEQFGGEFPVLKEELRTLGSAVSNASEATQKAILGSLATTTAEVLSVKSDIAGVATSLAQADDDRREIEKGQVSILATVKRSSADLCQIEETLKNAGDERQSIKSDVSTLCNSVLEQSSKLDAVARDLNTINATVESSTNGLKSEMKEAIERVALGHEGTITAVKSEAQLLLEAVARSSEQINATVGSSSEGVKETLLAEIQNIKQSMHGDLAATQSSVQEAKRALEAVSTNISEGFEKASIAMKAHEAGFEVLKSESNSLTETILREAREARRTANDIKTSVVLEVHEVKTHLGPISDAQTALQGSIQHTSKEIAMGFADLRTEMIDFDTAYKANLAAVTKSIHHNTKATQAAVDSARDRTLSEFQMSNLAIGSSLNGLKSDLGGVSKSIQTVNAGIRGEIGGLSEKTSEGFTNLDTSVRQANSSLSESIGNTQSSIEVMSGNVKAIDAAVRVNSAAIARVDKAVLETGSQVKGVVMDGNRDVLFQLDEELHENGTRIRGISEFDIPRLEAIGKRNRDALEVIGARVLGTAKKFDEMVTHHGQKMDGEVVNGRLRAPSSSSSSIVLRERA